MQGWRSRLHENGPLWVSWALAALIVLECASPIRAGLRGQPARLPATPFNPPVARRAPLDLQLIVGTHLFGIPAQGSNRDPASAAPTTANFHLYGTFATADPRSGMAIIAADNGEKLYKIGDEADGVALYSVYADHVLLDRAGQIESLSLPHAAADIAPARQFQSAAPDDPEARRLADIMSAEPSLDENSQRLLGFRVSPIAPNARFFKAGLRPGDLVTSINGTPLADQDRQNSQEVVDKALAASNATVSLLRIGRRMEVSVDVTQ
jgi:general secretion pathway protein C